MAWSGPGPSYVTAQMAAAVGKRFPMSRISFPICAADIRRWAIAVYYPAAPPRQFWDEEFARATKVGALVAPQEFNPFAWTTVEPPREGDGQEPGRAGKLDPDALIEGRLGIPGPGLSRVLNGGSEIEYGDARMRVGDVITACTFHRGYAEKMSSIGHLLVTVTEDRYVNQHSELVKLERKTLLRY